MSNTEILIWAWGFTIIGAIALGSGAFVLAATFGFTALLMLFVWAVQTF